MRRRDEADGALQVLVPALRIFTHLQRHDVTARVRAALPQNIKVIGIAIAAIQANQADSTSAITSRLFERE